MSKAYGRMISFEDAVRWAEGVAVPEGCEGSKACALNRLRYERDRNVPVKPRTRKGRTFDEHTCGNCGRGVEVGYRYCAGCGFAIDWRRDG